MLSKLSNVITKIERRHMSTFKELLGADNRKDQEARIKELLLKEANPEVILQIQYSGLTDKVVVNMFGGDVPFDVVHRMLSLAGNAIRREEMSIALAALEAETEEDKKK